MHVKMFAFKPKPIQNKTFYSTTMNTILGKQSDIFFFLTLILQLFLVLASSVLTFCPSGTISQYLLVRFDSFLVQMVSTMYSS